MDLVLPVDALPVFWGITKCPVSEDDARRVAPCIKRFLRKKGYSGPIAITAVGKLSKVPEKILEAVSSTGITLYDAPCGHKDILNLSGLYYMRNLPPTKIVVISPPHYFAAHFRILNGDEQRTIVHPFPPDSTEAEAKRLWQNFLADPVRCSRTVTPVSWVCGVCDDLAGRGFESFLTHRSSQEHAEEISLWEEKC